MIYVVTFDPMKFSWKYKCSASYSERKSTISNPMKFSLKYALRCK